MQSSEAASPPQRLVQGLLEGWRRLAQRPLTIAFYASLILIVALEVFAAPHRIHRWIADSLSHIDGGWRVLNGQRPHVDFFSGIGPVTYLTVALGMIISRSGAALDYGVAVAGAVFGIWAWSLFRNRVEAPAALLLALFVTLCASSPHMMGSRPDMLTAEGVYNRLGYALLIIVFVECLRSSPSEGLLGGVSSGVICVLTFFLKPSFFMAAVALICGSFLFDDRRRRKRILGMAMGFSASALIMLAYLRFDVAAVLLDLRTMAAARLEMKLGDIRVDIGPRSWLKSALAESPDLIGLLLLSLIVSMTPRAPRVWRVLDAWWPMAAAAAIFALEIVFRSGNAMQDSLPLVGTFALLLVSEMYAGWSRAPQQQRQAYSALCGFGLLCGLVMFVPEPLRDFSSVVYSSVESALNRPIAARFEPAHLGALVTLEPNPDWDEPANGKALVDEVNDGIRLLRRASAQTESVFTLNYFNPFPFALLRKPAPGAGSWLGPSFFSEKHPLPLDRLFGRVDLMMVPRHPEPSVNTRFLMRVVLPYVETHFHPAAESDYWIMYRRNGLTP